MSRSIVLELDDFSKEHSPEKLTVGKYTNDQKICYYLTIAFWVGLFVLLIRECSQQEWLNVVLLLYLLVNNFYQGIMRAYCLHYEAMLRWAEENDYRSVVEVIKHGERYSWSLVGEVTDCLNSRFLGRDMIEDTNRMSSLISEISRMRDASKLNGVKYRSALLIRTSMLVLAAISTSILMDSEGSFLIGFLSFYFVFFFAYGWYLVEDQLNRRYYRLDRLVSSLYRIQVG